MLFIYDRYPINKYKQSFLTNSSFHIEGFFASDLSKLYLTKFADNYKLIELRIS